MLNQSCGFCQPSTTLAATDRIPFLNVISKVAYLEFFRFSSTQFWDLTPTASHLSGLYITCVAGTLSPS